MKQRPIKFRGKRIDNGEWVFGFLTQKYTKESGFHGIGYYIEFWNKHDHLESHVADPETVGLKFPFPDKHGSDLYEGDIVRDSEEIYIIYESVKEG